MTEGTRRIAVVGIDGSGKSTVIRRFLDMRPGRDVVLMTCPLYHDAPEAPLAQLSRRLDAFSRAADELGSFELKAVSLFLQMTLYGPVERFFLETFRPRFLLSERHALVDSLAYGPFYQQMVRQNPDRRKLEGPLRERLGSETYEAILRWHELQTDVPFWDLARHVTDFFRLPPERLIAELARWYHTQLPDVVLLLDVPAEVAQRRVTERQGTQELHEQTGFLDALRKSYHHALQTLVGCETHVIETGRGVDETLQAVLDHAGVAR